MIFLSSLPHYLWINEKGKIIAITESHDVTIENVEKIIKGDTVQFTMKRQSRLKWNHTDLLFRNGNGGDANAVLSSSIISGYIDGMPSGTYVSQTQPEFNTVMMMNSDLRNFYKIAYDNSTDGFLLSLGLNLSQIRLKTKDTTKIVGVVNRKPVLENLYNYQLMIPAADAEELRRIVREDIKKYFDCKVKIKKKRMQCLILRSKDTSLITAMGDTILGYNEPNRFILVNKPFHWLIREIRTSLPLIPLVDETGMKGNITLELNGPRENFENKQNALAKYGLVLTRGIRKMTLIEVVTPKGEMPIQKIAKERK